MLFGVTNNIDFKSSTSKMKASWGNISNGLVIKLFNVVKSLEDVIINEVGSLERLMQGTRYDLKSVMAKLVSLSSIVGDPSKHFDPPTLIYQAGLHKNSMEDLHVQVANIKSSIDFLENKNFELKTGIESVNQRVFLFLENPGPNAAQVEKREFEAAMMKIR